MLAEDNRRKKLLLPQPKEDKLAHEGMKEISRLRKMAPLRCEDVRVRFHLDRKCSCCRRFEHVYVSGQFLSATESIYDTFLRSVPKSRTAHLIFDGWNRSNLFLLIMDIMIKQT